MRIKTKQNKKKRERENCNFFRINSNLSVVAVTENKVV